MRARRLIGAVILTVAIGAPLVEAFDRWDDTLRDGNDTEANLVIAALCVGLALTMVVTVVPSMRVLASRVDTRVTHSTRAAIALVILPPPIPTSSPPLALRI